MFFTAFCRQDQQNFFPLAHPRQFLNCTHTAKRLECVIFFKDLFKLYVQIENIIVSLLLNSRAQISHPLVFNVICLLGYQFWRVVLPTYRTHTSELDQRFSFWLSFHLSQYYYNTYESLSNLC